MKSSDAHSLLFMANGMVSIHLLDHLEKYHQDKQDRKGLLKFVFCFVP